MDRFNRIDNTAPVIDVAENNTPTQKTSSFDLNQKKITQALPYSLIPIDCIPTLPNTELFLNYDVQVTFRNPAIRKMLNGWRVYLHAYYNRNSDLWEGWNNFITKGRSGNITLKIPHIKTRLKKGHTPFTPMSLYNYLGYPSEALPLKQNQSEPKPELDKYTGVKLGKTTDISQYAKETKLANYTNIEISALKAIMYQKIWRDKYSPKNLLQDNKNLFPDNEDHFILSYNADEVSTIDYENENTEFEYSEDLDDLNYYTLNDKDKKVRIDCLRFRQFQGDRFTTASPFPEMLRGDMPNMDITLNTNDIAENLNIRINGQEVTKTDGTKEIKDPRSSINTTGLLTGKSKELIDYTLKDNLYQNPPEWNDNGRYATIQVGKDATSLVLLGTATSQEETTKVQSSITLSQLRSLEVFTLFAERMARTNGDYNEMIKAQFGYNPKTNNREAIYIGGSYQDIILNSIYQTSESTNNSALGQQVAQGISASYNKLGHFKADDYGYVMVIMSIVPETIYTTGISKLDTSLSFEEQYFPIMNNLSAEPILNKELYVSGEETKDNDVWGYGERFSEWKSRRNQVSGFSELPNTISEYDSALVMARRFDKTPELNANFVTAYPSNYSLDGFTSDEEPPFDVAIRADVNAYYPMPYATIPQGLGTRA